MEDHEQLLKRIGKNIKKYRKMKRFSLDQLGYDCGIDGTHIHKIEAGQRNITIKTLVKISSALDVPVNKLMI